MKNTAVVEKAFKAFDRQVRDETRRELNLWCWSIVESAVRARLNNPEAHNFTGNLLNSIVVCLYENGRPYAPYYASDVPGVTSAIRRKMKPVLEKRIYLRRDYEGRSSVYTPTVDTNGGWGRDDAEAFFTMFRPDGKNMFDVVVAYTVEYADWVDMQRKTTGFLETRKFAERTGVTFMRLKSA